MVVGDYFEDFTLLVGEAILGVSSEHRGNFWPFLP